ncbi:MAG: Fe-S cluster domain-containing protein [Mucinivorans sp.]
MSDVFLYTLIVLCAIGVISAVVLYFVSQKFKVIEDPRIDTTEALLPGANCGGCGFPGCRGLAAAAVKADDLSSIYCPVGGQDTMKAVAEHLGKIAPEHEPQVAVVRCNGSLCNRDRTNVFDGASTCAIEASLYGGHTDCAWGCLGLGDCVRVCKFDALHINTKTGLPEVDQDKCTACGACVKACPKMVIELRKKGVKDRRIFVSCVNKDRGPVAKKACTVACIGCGKCVKICPFGAITLEDNLAYIDPAICKLCRKCVAECPTGAIWEVGFPARSTEPAPALQATSVEPDAPESEKKEENTQN